jgi:hypothetical protein
MSHRQASGDRVTHPLERGGVALTCAPDRDERQAGEHQKKQMATEKNRRLRTILYGASRYIFEENSILAELGSSD